MLKSTTLIVSFASAIALSTSALGQNGSLTIKIKNHRFQPAALHAPANTPITLRIKNLDSTPMEFESVSLRVEKVIIGGGQGIVRLRPLSPGRYSFFDDFHQKTNGVLIIR